MSDSDICVRRSLLKMTLVHRDGFRPRDHSVGARKSNGISAAWELDLFVYPLSPIAATFGNSCKPEGAQFSVSRGGLEARINRWR